MDLRYLVPKLLVDRPSDLQNAKIHARAQGTAKGGQSLASCHHITPQVLFETFWYESRLVKKAGFHTA